MLFVGTLVSAMQSSARATELTFLCAAALESWMVEVIPEFQRTSGYEVKPTFQIINVITERVRKGTPLILPSYRLSNGKAFKKNASSTRVSGL